MLAFVVYFIIKLEDKNQLGAECNVDNDCVAASCCHASSCVSAINAPNCTGISCTMSCESILDCGNAECKCLQGKCSVVENNVKNIKNE